MLVHLYFAQKIGEIDPWMGKPWELDWSKVILDKYETLNLFNWRKDVQLLKKKMN